MVVLCPTCQWVAAKQIHHSFVRKRLKDPYVQCCKMGNCRQLLWTQHAVCSSPLFYKLGNVPEQQQQKGTCGWAWTVSVWNLTSSHKVAASEARVHQAMAKAQHTCCPLALLGREDGWRWNLNQGRSFGRAHPPEPAEREEAGTRTRVPTRSHHVVGPRSLLLLLCVHHPHARNVSVSWAGGNLRREGRVFTHPISLWVKDEARQQESQDWDHTAS